MLYLIDSQIRRAVPFLLTLFFVLLEAIRVPVPGFYMVTPAFALMALFYWTAVRAHSLPPVAVFALGLVADIVTGSAFGTNVLLFLLVHVCVRSQGDILEGNNFLFLWAGFCVVAMAVTLTNWAFEAVINGPVVNPNPALARLVLSAIIYPPVAAVLGLFNRMLPKSVHS